MSRMKLRTNKKGRSIVSIFQDINADGKAARHELIFRGKSRIVFASDGLTNFTGNVRLKKTMHKCDWLSMKFPDMPLVCTEEYIPITYQLDFMADNGEDYRYDGIGKFKNGLL